MIEKQLLLINSFNFILILGMNMRSLVSKYMYTYYIIYVCIPNLPTSYCYNYSLHKFCKNILLLLHKTNYDKIVHYTIIIY